MSKDNKYQNELILKKINKIKSFKEKVLRVREEEFKNPIVNQNISNNIKVIKENDDNSKSKNKHEKNYQKNKLKLLPNELSLSLGSKKFIEDKKKAQEEEKELNNIKPILYKENKEERSGRFLNKDSYNLINKNFKINKTVQLKPIKKIEIESKLSPRYIANNENNIIRENISDEPNQKNKDNNNTKDNKDNREGKDNNIKENKNDCNNKTNEELNNKEKVIEKNTTENGKTEEKGLIKSASKPNSLSLSFKGIQNKIIIGENPKKEEEKNNINIKDIIKIQKIASSSVSPDNHHNNSNKPKFKKREKKEYKLQYCVYPGNNSKLIETVMEHRKQDWEKVPITYSGFCDLVWAPLSCTINFQNCESKHQYVNHIEFNNEISNKMRLYANLLRHCEEKKIDAFSIFPFTITLQVSHRSFNEQLGNFEKLYKNINSYTPKSNKKFSEMFNVILSKKIGSTQNINIPETFNDGKNLWIIKPVNLNRGRFITVDNNLKNLIKKAEEIQNKKKINIDEKKKAYEIKCEYLILQKYLEKPLLYQGRKFDIRLWVLFISEQEDDIYIFKQGHLKATCTQYDPNSKDLYVHLTNYSVQKYNENFSKIEIGNEIPFSSFQNELDKNNTGKNFYKDIYPKIVRIVRITGGAAKGKINFLSKRYCFEIFGYDFILDNNFQPYLLEINTNPGLEISSPLIETLLPRLVDDAFKLTIDKEFTKSYKYANKESTFPVEGYGNNENMWEKFSII